MKVEKLLRDLNEIPSPLGGEYRRMSNINVIKKIGNKPGKTIVILAGVHGNETCGIKAFDKIIPKLEVKRGKVIFIYANLEAIKQDKRFIEFNLNRCFLKKQPTDVFNTLEGRTAREIMPYLESADLVLDIHASYVEDSIPFVICDEKQVKNAGIFDAGIVSCNWDPFELGSTDHYMNLQNKPGFCFECGYLGDRDTQKIAEEAIINFLIYAGSIEGNLTIRKNQRTIRIKSLYKNKAARFKLVRYFPDFEKFLKRTLIGIEGKKKVYAKAGDIILFAKDKENINEECFLLAEETLLNQNQLTKQTKEAGK